MRQNKNVKSWMLTIGSPNPNVGVNRLPTWSLCRWTTILNSLSNGVNMESISVHNKLSIVKHSDWLRRASLNSHHKENIKSRSKTWLPKLVSSGITYKVELMRHRQNWDCCLRTRCAELLSSGAYKSLHKLNKGRIKINKN